MLVAGKIECHMRSLINSIVKDGKIPVEYPPDVGNIPKRYANM
jgi:hypothetical protein